MIDNTFRRNNHYVPEFLLRSLSPDNAHLWEYRLLVEDIRVPEWEWRSASRLARTSDLYTIAEAADESDRMERWLDKEFEHPARDAVLAVVTGQHLSKTQWRKLVRLYASQFLRTPAYFVRHKDHWARVMETEFIRARDRLLPELPKCRDADSDLLVIDGEDGFPLRYSIRREGGLRRSLHIQHVTGRKYWMWVIQSALRTNGLAADLEQYKWSILTAPVGFNWFLTDNPAVCIRRLPDGKQSLDGGWKVAGSKLMLPLSEKHLLYCQVGYEDQEQYSIVHPLVAAHIRSDIADAAFRSYYSPMKNTPLAAYKCRKVDRLRFQEEARQWAAFGQEHTRAEKFE